MKTKLCNLTKTMIISQLKGISEFQEKNYTKLFEQEPEKDHKRLRDAYNHHLKELEDLIKYQKERNGN